MVRPPRDDDHRDDDDTHDDKAIVPSDLLSSTDPMMTGALMRDSDTASLHQLGLQHVERLLDDLVTLAQIEDPAAFVAHGRRVATLLAVAGETRAVVAAGLLYEIPARTPFSAAMLAPYTGDAVAAVIAAVTPDASLINPTVRRAELYRRAAAHGRAAATILAAALLDSFPYADDVARRDAVERARLHEEVSAFLAETSAVIGQTQLWQALASFRAACAPLHGDTPADRPTLP